MSQTTPYNTPAPPYDDVKYGNQPPPAEYPPQGYGAQPGYAGQPGQPGYAGQPSYGPPPIQPQSVIVVQPPPPTDYTMPRAKVPAILLIVFAVLNFIGIIVFAVLGAIVAEFVIAFLLYMCLGVLAALGAFRPQHSTGIPIGVLVVAVCALVFSFVQVILRALVVTVSAHLRSEAGKAILGLSVILLILALLAFNLCIALIVLACQVLCGVRRSGTVHGQQNQPAGGQPQGLYI